MRLLGGACRRAGCAASLARRGDRRPRALRAPAALPAAGRGARADGPRIRRGPGREESRISESHIYAAREDEDRHAQCGKRPQPSQRSPTTRLRCRPEPLPGTAHAVRKQRTGRLQRGSSTQEEVSPCCFKPADDNRPRPPQPGPDALKAIGRRLDTRGRTLQGSAQCRLALTERAHTSRSSTVRSACIALAVWLLTAPRLICMASAICASDISA